LGNRQNTQRERERVGSKNIAEKKKKERREKEMGSERGEKKKDLKKK
jgi:hypothetical protein